MGFEFSFQTQTFDVCYIFSHTLSHKKRKRPRLIRILSQEQTRDGTRLSCCSECGKKEEEEEENYRLAQYHSGSFIQIGKCSCDGVVVQVVSPTNLCLAASNTVCDHAQLSLSSSPSCFAMFHIWKGKQTSSVIPPLFASGPTSHVLTPT